jgi:hypothetical protein
MPVRADEPARQTGTWPPDRCWRVLIAMPPAGLGEQFVTMRGWLDHYCGPGGWSWAPAGTGGVANDAIAVYFVTADAAQAFVRRFSCGYRAARLT